MNTKRGNIDDNDEAPTKAVKLVGTGEMRQALKSH
jgi:hypothetical protein